MGLRRQVKKDTLFSPSVRFFGITAGHGGCSISMFTAHKKREARPSHLWQQVLVGTIATLVLACPCVSWALGESATAEMPSISLHGFGTLGATRSTTDNVQFVRDLSQPDGAGSQWATKVDSLLGLQANIHFSPNTEAVLQAATRYHADRSYQPELTWAFLRHDFSSDFSLRAGRLGTEFYMLGDSRLVGYSNLSVRPPPDFYGSLVFSYIDGLDASATWPVASGLLKSKIFAGHSPEKAPFAPGILWDQHGTRLVGAYLDYQSGPWQVRLSHAQVRFEHETPTDELLQANGDPLMGMPYLSLVPEMAMAGQRARFSSLGLVFDQGPLNIQLMFNQIKHDSPAYADSRAGYALAAYRLGAVTPYVGISRSFSDVVPLPSSPIPGIDQVTQSLVSQSYTDHHTLTLGARWDFQKNLALKAQLDRVRGKPTSVFLFKGNQPGWDGTMTVFSLALDFVF